MHKTEKKYAPENGTCPKVVTGKWLLEIKKQKKTQKMKPGPTTN